MPLACPKIVSPLKGETIAEFENRPPASNAEAVTLVACPCAGTRNGGGHGPVGARGVKPLSEGRAPGGYNTARHSSSGQYFTTIVYFPLEKGNPGP